MRRRHATTFARRRAAAGGGHGSCRPAAGHDRAPGVDGERHVVGRTVAAIGRLQGPRLGIGGRRPRLLLGVQRLGDRQSFTDAALAASRRLAPAGDSGGRHEHMTLSDTSGSATARCWRACWWTASPHCCRRGWCGWTGWRRTGCGCGPPSVQPLSAAMRARSGATSTPRRHVARDATDPLHRRVQPQRHQDPRVPRRHVARPALARLDRSVQPRKIQLLDEPPPQGIRCKQSVQTDCLQRHLSPLRRPQARPPADLTLRRHLLRKVATRL
jgi:hypothetical protein